MYNPLAVGVTLGGLLLDIVVPRPKPRVGDPVHPSLLLHRADARTVRHSGGRRAQPSAGGER